MCRLTRIQRDKDTWHVYIFISACAIYRDVMHVGRLVLILECRDSDRVFLINAEGIWNAGVDLHRARPLFYSAPVMIPNVFHL